MYLVGIDIGGTFTDFVLISLPDGILTTFKLLTDNNNPAKTVIDGLNILGQKMSEESSVALVSRIVHGSTVATNAMLEQQGAKVALITTKGFEDVFEIGRQNRIDLYSLNPSKPSMIVPQDFRFGVSERINYRGEVERPLDKAELAQIIYQLRQSAVESVAISLLFSYANPIHEQEILDKLNSLDVFVTASSMLLPEIREYERTSTTVINAYVSPKLRQYLSNLQKWQKSDTDFYIMQSNGGVIDIEIAKNEGVRCILSGPAGGVIGARFIYESIQNKLENKNFNIVTLDIGGTSTDVSLIKRYPVITTQAEIGGYPIRVPMLDIHTVGAGGGSIAYVDAGNSLKVGPKSAGADPGPACYGKDFLPTVTDANVVLGRILPEYFLGGTMEIFPERSYRAIQVLSERIGLSVPKTAHGIIQIANSHMERAIRVISVERGMNPEELTLVAYGGAGGLHACELAKALNIPRVIVPAMASTLSAFGMAVSDLQKDYVQSVMLSGDKLDIGFDYFFTQLENRAMQDFSTKHYTLEDFVFEQYLDVRFVGQSYELTIPYTGMWKETFIAEHEREYGFVHQGKGLEVVNVRLSIKRKAPLSGLDISLKPEKSGTNSFVSGARQVYVDGRFQTVNAYNARELKKNVEYKGPALIIREDTTIFLPPNTVAFADESTNILINL